MNLSGLLEAIIVALLSLQNTGQFDTAELSFLTAKSECGTLEHRDILQVCNALLLP